MYARLSSLAIDSKTLLKQIKASPKSEPIRIPAVLYPTDIDEKDFWTELSKVIKRKQPQYIEITQLDKLDQLLIDSRSENLKKLRVACRTWLLMSVKHLCFNLKNVSAGTDLIKILSQYCTDNYPRLERNQSGPFITFFTTDSSLKKQCDDQELSLLELSNNHLSDFYLAKADLCSDHRQHTKALKYTTYAIQLNPDYADAYFYRAKLYIQIDKYSDGIDDLYEALQAEVHSCLEPSKTMLADINAEIANALPKGETLSDFAFEKHAEIQSLLGEFSQDEDEDKLNLANRMLCSLSYLTPIEEFLSELIFQTRAITYLTYFKLMPDPLSALQSAKTTFEYLVSAGIKDMQEKLSACETAINDFKISKKEKIRERSPTLIDIGLFAGNQTENNEEVDLTTFYSPLNDRNPGSHK